jgi:hypothetical protein
MDTETKTTINLTFVLLAGFLCFLLQASFGLLEVGSVREKVRGQKHIFWQDGHMTSYLEPEHCSMQSSLSLD